MKRVFAVAAAFLAGAVVAALAVRLSGPASREPDVIVRGVTEMNMRDLAGDTVNLATRLSPRGATWLMFFGLDQCYSCVARGLADLTLLRKRGEHCLAVAVHPNLDEVKGWLTHESFRPIFVISRAAFLNHVECRSLPVILRMENGRVTSCAYPTP